MAVNPGLASEGLIEALTKLDSEENLSLLQVGACDGKNFDPVFRFLNSREGARAVFAEPIIEYFKDLIDNYSFLKCPVFLNVAVSDYDGEAVIRYVNREAIEDGSVPRWAMGISTLERDKNAIDGVAISKANFDLISAHVSKRTIPVVSINSLLKIDRIRATNVYVSDCEGHDGRLIMSMDMSVYQPKILFFESMLLSLDEKQRVREKLLRYGYTLVEDEVDMLGLKT